MGVDTSHQPLGSGLFVTRGSVHLTGEEEVLHYLRFERKLELGRVEIIVFHSVGRLEYLHMLKPFYRAHGIHLHIQRER